MQISYETTNIHPYNSITTLILRYLSKNILTLLVWSSPTLYSSRLYFYPAYNLISNIACVFQALHWDQPRERHQGQPGQDGLQEVWESCTEEVWNSQSPCVQSSEEPHRFWVEHIGQWKSSLSTQPRFHTVCLKLCVLVCLSTRFAGQALISLWFHSMSIYKWHIWSKYVK